MRWREANNDNVFISSELRMSGVTIQLKRVSDASSHFLPFFPPLQVDDGGCTLTGCSRQKDG